MINVKGINIKNCIYYFFDDMINIKDIDLNHIGLSKRHTKIFVFTALANSIKPLFLNMSIVNGYTEKHNGNKYLTLVHTDKTQMH